MLQILYHKLKVLHAVVGFIAAFLQQVPLILQSLLLLLCLQVPSKGSKGA